VEDLDDDAEHDLGETPEEELLEQAKKRDDACWLWKAARHPGGYGAIAVKGSRRIALAHRYIYELLVGPIPNGMQLDHLCRQRGCVNPAHLRVVTSKENSNAPGSKCGSHFRLKTHCPKGHPYDSGNTYIGRAGARVCRACKSEKAKRDWARKRQERAA